MKKPDVNKTIYSKELMWIPPGRGYKTAYRFTRDESRHHKLYSQGFTETLVSSAFTHCLCSMVNINEGVSQYFQWETVSTLISKVFYFRRNLTDLIEINIGNGFIVTSVKSCCLLSLLPFRLLWRTFGFHFTQLKLLFASTQELCQELVYFVIWMGWQSSRKNM
jgi:hypothetical protein